MVMVAKQEVAAGSLAGEGPTRKGGEGSAWIRVGTAETRKCGKVRWTSGAAPVYQHRPADLFGGTDITARQTFSTKVTLRAGDS